MTFKTLIGFKYIYLVVFFILLTGFFDSLITNSNFNRMISGVLILFVGHAGGILLYRSTTSKNKKGIFLGSGFALIAISLYYIFQFTGRA